MKTFKALKEEIYILESFKKAETYMNIHNANKLKNLTNDEHHAFEEYKMSDIEKVQPLDNTKSEEQGPSSALLNGYLKHHYDNNYKGMRYLHPNQNPSKKIKAMDNALKRHKTDRDLSVYTGIRSAPKTDENGLAHLPGFTSTTLDRRVAKDFAEEKRDSKEKSTHILHIKLPAGSHAASLHHVLRETHRDDESDWEDHEEHEILMARGHTIKVNPTPTISKGRIKHHIWHATVVKHEPKDIE